MKTLYKEDFKNQTITHPRYKTLQIITLNNGEVWVNLNNLCHNCRTTTTSAIASLPSQEQHLRYMKITSDNLLQILTDESTNAIEYTPYINLNAIPIVNLFRPRNYKKQIADWIVLELLTPILPTINQMVILSTQSDPNDPPRFRQPQPHCTQSNYPEVQNRRYFTHTQTEEPTATDLHQIVSDDTNHKFEPYNAECTLPQLVHRFHQYGNPISAKSLLKWLQKHQYCSTAPDRKYRPQDRWYNAGYFVDNRHTFNTFYPQRNLLFTPLGQRYFYEKLTPSR